MHLPQLDHVSALAPFTTLHLLTPLPGLSHTSWVLLLLHNSLWLSRSRSLLDLPFWARVGVGWALPVITHSSTQPRPLPGPCSPVHVPAHLPSCLLSRRPGAERLRSKGLRQAVTLAATSLVKSRSLQRCLRERRGRGRGPRSHHPSFIHRVTELLRGPRVGLWEADDTRYADPHWRAAARAGPRTLSAREGHCPLRDVAPRHSLWVEAVHRPRVPADT